MVNLNALRGGFAHRRCADTAEWGLFLGHEKGNCTCWKYRLKYTQRPQSSIHSRKVNGVPISTQHGGILSLFMLGFKLLALACHSANSSLFYSILFFAAHMNRSPSTACSGLDRRRFGLPSTDIPPPASPPGTTFRDRFERATARPKSDVIVT